MEIHSGHRYCHRKTGKAATVLTSMPIGWAS